MDLKKLKFLSILLAVMASFALAGCGDDDSGGNGTTGPTVTCGEGTMLVEDTCVGDTGLTCGAGTMLNAGGTACEASDTGTEIECGPGTVLMGTECVDDGSGPPPVNCGAGTVLNGAGTECVPDNTGTGLVCGDGTIENGAGDACVPVCGPGSIADQMTGECIVDLGVICTEGTFVSSNDTCVDWAGLLRDQAEAVFTSDDATASDDPFLFNFVLDNSGGPTQDDIITATRVTTGVPIDVALPMVGNTSVLDGAITLIGDVSGDGLDDQDWDVFAFEAQAGQLLRLTTNSTGLPSPTFEVYQIEGVDPGTDLTSAAVLADYFAFADGIEFIRLSPQRQGLSPSREYFLAEAGVYFLRVTDGSHTAPELNDYTGEGLPLWYVDNGTQTGGDDFTYLVAVENLGIIDPVTFADDPANVFEIAPENDATNILSGSADEYGRVSEEVVLVRKQSDTPGGEPGFTTIDVTSYDEEVFEGILGRYSADLSESFLPIGLGSGGSLTVPLPAEGLIFNHDFFTSNGKPGAGYSVGFKATPELIANVPVTLTMGDLLTADAVAQVPDGEILEVTVSNIGDGVQGVLIFQGITPDFEYEFLGCATLVPAITNPDVGCVDISTSNRVARYFETGDGSPSSVLVTMIDIEESGGATNFDYTLEAALSLPTTVALDDVTRQVSTVLANVSSQAAVRWLKIDVMVAGGSVSHDTSSDQGTSELLMEIYAQEADSITLSSSAASPTPGDPVSLNGGSGAETNLIRIEQTAGPTSELTVASVLTLPDFAFMSTPAAPISDTLPPVSDAISVADACGGAGDIQNISVDVDITHTWRGDLTVDLVHPDGVTVVRLHDATGGNAQDLLGNYPASLVPAEPLDGFAGLMITGDWTLNVVDGAGGDDGTLNSWGLNFFCVSPPPP